MAATVLTDAVFTINSVDLSHYVRKVTLEVSVKEEDVTAMGGNGYTAKVAGLKDYTVTVDFNQDFTAGAVDATLWPLFAQTAPFTLKPTSSAVSTTNPQYSGTVLVSKYVPLDGSVGAVSTTSIPFSAAGPLSRATT